MENKEIADPYQKICKNENCKAEFIASRLNQQFCAATCKSQHNNHIAHDLNMLMKKTSDQHKLNRKILQELYSKKKFIVKEKELDLLSFNINKATGFHSNPKTSKEVFEYFEYTLEVINLNEFKIGMELPE